VWKTKQGAIIKFCTGLGKGLDEMQQMQQKTRLRVDACQRRKMFLGLRLGELVSCRVACLAKQAATPRQTGAGKK